MDKVVYFYGGIEPILRIIVVGSLAYISLGIFLRISGKRTLSQMNAFDFIITIAIGSSFGRILTAKGVSLAEAVTAFLLLIVLQSIISWLTIKSSMFAKLVTANPSLLYFRGQFLRDTMKEHGVTQKQLLAVVRQQGISSLQDVEAIVLEATGTFAVVKTGDSSNNSALSNVPEINQDNLTLDS